jgi:Flp pilus assembly pilin Flp
VRRSLARYLADTSSSASVEYALLAAGVALAIVLGLIQLGVPGRSAARTLLIGNQKPEIGNQKGSPISGF